MNNTEDTTIHDITASTEFTGTKQPENIEESEKAFLDYVIKNSASAIGNDTTKLLGDIKKELSLQKSFQTFEDFFDFIKKYYESVDGLDGVHIYKNISNTGNIVLTINYFNDDVLNIKEQLTPLASFSFTEYIKYQGDDGLLVFDKFTDFDQPCSKRKIDDFISTIGTMRNSFNSHFGSNHGIRILELFQELVNIQNDKETVRNCDIVQVIEGVDPISDFIALKLFYDKNSDEQNRIINCKAVIMLRNYYFLNKIATN